MANVPTTLERASFSGPKGSTIVCKFVDATSYVLGAACNVGPVIGTVTNVMSYNTVKLQVTGNPNKLLLPKGTAVS
jgi:hypothetical protein